MKVKELIEELQKCNPDAPVEINYSGKEIEAVNNSNPANSVLAVILLSEK